jgi:DNA repair photolyase
MKKTPHGTQEWADTNVNVAQGCTHDCLYCYAKGLAIRFGRATPGSWTTQVVRKGILEKGYNKRAGTIMFPSSHDITPDNIDTCVDVLKKMLEPGNRVLIVSKPHLECVKRLCKELEGFKEQILFRFTIGSVDDKILGYWEPGAPGFKERLAALRYAHEQGFQTSVSCEPMLDGAIDLVIKAVRPCVSHSIWLGRANQLVMAVTRNTGGDKKALTSARELNATWNDDAVRALYERYKSDALIFWKDSIKKVVGLAKPEKKGLDI